MSLKQVSWFYEEPEKTSRRLFDSVSQGVQCVSPRALRQFMRGLQLFISDAECREILSEVLNVFSGAVEVDWRVFRAMRLSGPKMPAYGLLLNVLAEYSKYNCAYIHRGFITEDAIETALQREGNAQYVSFVQENMLKLCFNARHRILGLKELFSFMRGLVPNQWRQWACDQFARGEPLENVVKALKTAGFQDLTAQETAEMLYEHGFQSALPHFIDASPLSVTHIFV